MDRPVQAVFFDFDGVLAESVDVKTAAFAELYAGYGEDVVARVVAHHRANGGMSRFDKVRVYHAEFVGEPLDATTESALLQRFSDLVEENVVGASWVNGAQACLERAFGRFPLYVVSATPQAEMERIIDRREMAEWFTSIHGSPTGKAAHLSRIIEDNGFDSAATVMVGDAIADYNAAVAVGCAFLGRVPAGAENPFNASVHTVTDLAEVYFP